VMAFGSGVLISALSFELMDEAFRAMPIQKIVVPRRGGSYARKLVTA